MDYSVPEVTSAEREFYGENTILLEGAISEFLSCMDMIRRLRGAAGNRDPVVVSNAHQERGEYAAKAAKGSLSRHGGKRDENVFDAAGVRLVCPFIQISTARRS